MRRIDVPPALDEFELLGLTYGWLAPFRGDLDLARRTWEAHRDAVRASWDLPTPCWAERRFDMGMTDDRGVAPPHTGGDAHDGES